MRRRILHRSRRRAAAIAGALAAAVTATAAATHLPGGTEGHSTVERTVVHPEGDGYRDLVTGPGEPYIVRDGGHEENSGIPAAQPGRDRRRVSLAYMSQLTDFQLADEESPARVEFVDPGATSAWRPQEGFTPFQIEATIRQINHFAGASPVLQGDGTRNAMDFALLTGDQADNQQLNETVWVRDLLEGNGPTTFNSGLSRPEDYANPAGLGDGCALFVAQQGGAEAAAAEGGRYTGVQDYDDYPADAPVTPTYYDPDRPLAPAWATWPEYDGLMDRAQQLTLDPEGLDVPFYVTNGNHDVLLQGNEDAIQAIERIATGCTKVLATTNDPTQVPPPPEGADPRYLLSPANVGMLVPPDPSRRTVSKPQIKEIYGATDEGPADDDHGFAYVDPAEAEASRGSASYYAWDPRQTPGFRFISVDTNSEGGQTAEGQSAVSGSANGNIDDPQFQWFKRELAAAAEREQLVVVFGHHPVRSLNASIRDEQAAPCTTDDEHGHDVSPGCDLDPRPSDDDPDTPGFGCIHNGTDEHNSTCPGGDAQHESFVELLDQFPNVVAYVPGHTHEHRLTPFVRSDGTTWWEINTSAVIDPPNQSRLIELMDNRDGTLSIFNTVVDHAAAATAPADCPDGDAETPDCAATFTADELASIGRTFSHNDPDNDGSGTGRVIDRNAELLLEDPRPVTDLAVAVTDAPDPVRVGQELTYTVTVGNGGAEPSQDTTVTDELPAGVTVTGTEASQGACGRDGRTVECDLGSLPAGASATVSVRVVPEEPGLLRNRARARGNVADRHAANDSDTTTTTVLAAAPGGAADGQPGKPATPGTPGTPASPPAKQPSCAAASSMPRADARPRGGRVRFALPESADPSMRIDVFQVATGRRVTGERLVARFARASSSFTWDGRANRRGRRIANGYFFARLHTTTAAGDTTVRRDALRRRGGRWLERPAFDRSSCGLVARAKLRRPAFGGSEDTSLGVAYQLARPARVRIEVLRGARRVAAYRFAKRRGGTWHRKRFSAIDRPRGDYRFRIIAQRGGRTVTRTVVARRL